MLLPALSVPVTVKVFRRGCWCQLLFHWLRRQRKRQGPSPRFIGTDIAGIDHLALAIAGPVGRRGDGDYRSGQVYEPGVAGGAFGVARLVGGPHREGVAPLRQSRQGVGLVQEEKPPPSRSHPKARAPGALWLSVPEKTKVGAGLLSGLGGKPVMLDTGGVVSTTL